MFGKTNSALLDDDFARKLLEKAEGAVFEGPQAFYNADGDCIELILSNESYRAERLDDLITIFVGRDSSEPVGAVLKGVKRFIKQIQQTQPGAHVDFSGASVRLEYLLTAGLWRSSRNDKTVRVYLELRQIAEEAELEVSLQSITG